MNLKIIFLVAVCGFTSSAWADFVENTDITSYVNQLIKKQKVVSIPAGTYKIDANKSIIPKDGSEIRLTPQTKLTVIPTKYGSYRVFQIKNVDNVKILGGSLIGDKYTHLGNTGEWGMGIEIRDSKNISVSDMNIDKMWGDAIYVGTNGKNANYNITLNNIRMNDNRRQGLTIISANKLIASNIKATNTKGAKPASGIDIEPNNGSMILKDIELKNIVTSGNAGSGIQIGLSRYNNSTSPVSISISNHQDTKSQYGILLGAINSKALGSVTLDSLNHSSNSCFNSWSNNRFKVAVHGSTSISKLKSCMGHLKNSNISFK
ncbi:right-handed parallel beta-helix repeat-containing protein [Acinetobacter sp. ANC 4779]|uniref:right-handed parallel beta-helix repeat-containing protein n=1 Tax=Acinetobacter sp. ANC 4779 TaxID=2529848 RepID=UPI00103D10A6|nr:right-handed parallel beta-helix repeat-containing protein [Acinetobacter sp. ANC 4779]TCB50948.1 right-handed parallel beta-helix repeat-containing protein [Acinetobacter sp. ANC 4779]